MQDCYNLKSINLSRQLNIKMNKQKLQAFRFQQNFDHTKKRYEIDGNNNNNNYDSFKNGIIGINQNNQKFMHKTNRWNGQPIFNYPTALKSCLKINDKSKGGKYQFIQLHLFSQEPNKNRRYVWCISIFPCSSKR